MEYIPYGSEKERGEKGYTFEDMCNMNGYLVYLIPTMLRELAEKPDSFRKEAGTVTEWEKELLKGAELWDDVCTDDFPDDDLIPEEYWEAVRKQRLHKAMEWLEENYFDLWD